MTYGKVKKNNFEDSEMDRNFNSVNSVFNVYSSHSVSGNYFSAGKNICQQASCGKTGL